MSSNLAYKEDQKKKAERVNELLKTKGDLSRKRVQEIVSSFSW